MKAQTPRIIGTNVYIAPGSRIHPSCQIGHGSCIGYPSETSKEPVVIGPNCTIGCFCVIHSGAAIGQGVSIDHYSRIGSMTTVGDYTFILYGARIHDRVTIGAHCRIAGNCPERTVIGDYVTHMGRLVHSYRQPFADWDTTEEPSPHIESYCVIGANALVIGGVRIGHHSYIAAGEIVREDVPPKSVVYRGQVIPAEQWEGRLKDLGFFNFE